MRQMMDAELTARIGPKHATLEGRKGTYMESTFAQNHYSALWAPGFRACMFDARSTGTCAVG
jgi:hypothetical protein